MSFESRSDSPSIDFDAIRYARDWRYGHMKAPRDVEGDVERVSWMAYLTWEDRARYAEDFRLSGGHLEFLSEREIAVAIEVSSREALWDYFDFSNPEVVEIFLRNRSWGIYGKADPRRKAPSGHGL